MGRHHLVIELYQGLVLGPLLFLIYINDSVREKLNTGSFVTMYADDLLLYRVINSAEDYKLLQDDINTLAKWVDNNHLTLNASKCKCMVISRLKKRSIPFVPLKLHEQAMEKVSQYKYLGVIIKEDLTWSSHINEITTKARRMVGLSYRQFYAWTSTPALLQLYKSIVRPHVEYASQVWSPYLLKDIQRLEAVQKFALKVCFKCWDSGNYYNFLRMAQLPDPKVCRDYLNLCYFFKLIHGIFVFPNNPLVLRQTTYPTRNSRNNLFVRPPASCNSFHHSFFPHTISLWNSLPSSVAHSPSVFSFKRQLLTYLSTSNL